MYVFIFIAYFVYCTLFILYCYISVYSIGYTFLYCPLCCSTYKFPTQWTHKGLSYLIKRKEKRTKH